ncbi:MAG: V-type ATP synthase subunit D [Bacillota bacterium]
MAQDRVFPTKGNLMALKRSRELAQMGQDLMSRKRNILIREMMTMIDDVKKLRDEISETYRKAYAALQEANITLGIVNDIAKEIPIDRNIEITYRSVMGVEIPKVSHEQPTYKLKYGIASTNTKFDYAFKNFNKARDLTVLLVEVDNGVYRLASAIRKARKRENALKNIVLPRYKANIKYITDTLEEKDREEFTRQKIIKARKGGA